MQSRRHASLCVCGLLLGFAWGGRQAPGQNTAVATISPATQAALHDLARIAGVIFTGEVAAVRRLDGNGGSTGVVEIDFTVDDAVRGASGGSYTLREWAGLWDAGDPPFRVGRRYLVLLHPPGAAGLSSPIGGTDGAVPIRAGATGAVIDLRWVAARVVQYRAESVARPAEVRENAAAGTVPSAAQSAAYNTVLALLRDWEKDDAAAH